jgi:hypothetical protein
MLSCVAVHWNSHKEEPCVRLDSSFSAIPDMIVLEHTTGVKIIQNVAFHFLALSCRFIFVYVMMSGIFIGVMLSFTLYIKS